MKKLLIGLLVTSSLSAFAQEIRGLKCQTNYIVHEKNRSLNMDRSRTTKSITFIRVIDEKYLIPVNNPVSSYCEGSRNLNSDINICYGIRVGQETSNLEVAIGTDLNGIKLFSKEFDSKEGITVSVNLLGKMKLETDSENFIDFTDVIISCHPRY